MDRRSVPERKRQRLEAGIRAIDMFAYAVAATAGATLLALPLSPATGALRGYPIILGVWAALLIGGGVAGFLGRLTRYWMIEAVGTVACVFGLMIHLVVLGGYALTSVVAAFTWLIVLLAYALTFRRWLELQIFGSEPGDWRRRIADAWARRTANVVEHR